MMMISIDRVLAMSGYGKIVPVGRRHRKKKNVFLTNDKSEVEKVSIFVQQPLPLCLADLPTILYGNAS